MNNDKKKEKKRECMSKKRKIIDALVFSEHRFKDGALKSFSISKKLSL